MTRETKDTVTAALIHAKQIANDTLALGVGLDAMQVMGMVQQRNFLKHWEKQLERIGQALREVEAISVDDPPGGDYGRA